MVERIRDSTVAEAIAAAAGTDETPELVLGDVVHPTLSLERRPPLAASGYFPGMIGVLSAAVALNTSHVGIFGSGVGRAIVEVTSIIITNTSGGVLNYQIRRVDSPFTGFPSTRAVPGYINAGLASTGGIFSIVKSDTVGAQGLFVAQLTIPDLTIHTQPCSFILNDGILLVACGAVNKDVRAGFTYRHWPAVRVQPQG